MLGGSAAKSPSVGGYLTDASLRKRSPRRPRQGGSHCGGGAAKTQGGAGGLRAPPVALRASPADRSLPPSPPALPKKNGRPPKKYRRLSLLGLAADPPSVGGYLTETWPPSLREDAVAPGHVRALPRRVPRLCGRGCLAPVARRRRAGGRNKGAFRPRRFRPALARRPSRTFASLRKRSPRRPRQGGSHCGGGDRKDARGRGWLAGSAGRSAGFAR